MNKIATYLNQHLLGEASSAQAIRRRFSRDGSILTITPELVVFPRVTNDIRKVARFTWQLAEKGHAMGLTLRGTGADTTGAAIGKGITIDTSVYLNSVISIIPKDRLALVQPGLKLDALDQALRWQGLAIPEMPTDLCHTTVGGAIAGNAFGSRSPFSQAIERMEVVLANGDVIETGRIKRNIVNKKLGLQTFEGEIYRKLSGLIEDNEALIEQIAKDGALDAVGYRSITQVKQKDGSFDLTPLFVGSQGTLGAISEVVLKADFFSQESAAAVVVLDTPELARDLAERYAELRPARLLLIDGGLLTRAQAYGKQFSLLGDHQPDKTILIATFSDMSERVRHAKLKKMRKVANKLNLTVLDSNDHEYIGFQQILDAPQLLDRLAGDEDVNLPVLQGAFVPRNRREEFSGLVTELAARQHVEFVGITNVLTDTITYYPDLKLHSVSEKQKLFRVMNDYAALVSRSGGAFIAEGGEGRLKANAAWSVLADEEVALYEQVRAIFDPFKTLNPDVKQPSDVRQLVAALRASYDTTDFLA